LLGFARARLEHTALPLVWYPRVMTDTSDSSAGSISQVSWSSCAQVAPAASSVDRRPPDATELASPGVASVPGHMPCCGLSTSGQIHATCSCCVCVLAVPPGQYGRKVRAAAVYPTPGALARTWSGKTPNRV